MKRNNRFRQKANYLSKPKIATELLKELKQERLTIGYNGGLFILHPLINLVLLENKKYTTAVIDDRNNNHSN